MKIKSIVSVQLIRLLKRCSLTTVTFLMMFNIAQAVDIGDLIEIGVDDFVELVVGNTIKGRFLAGGRSIAYFDPNGSLTGRSMNSQYIGSWKTRNNNNCLELVFDPSDPRRCWSLLQDPEVDTYHIGVKKKSGKYLVKYEIEIYQGKSFY